MNLIFDIETDGLLNKLTKVHCLVIQDADNGSVTVYDNRTSGTRIEIGLNWLMKADRVIGHNVLGFDIPALKKLYPFFDVAFEKVYDTLVVSRLIYSDIMESDIEKYRKGEFQSSLIGKHSLKAWGVRIGFFKGDYGDTSDWSEYSDEMRDYCVRDVGLTKLLYERLSSKNYSQDAIELEHAIHQICLEQEWHGFPFDVQKAARLYGELLTKRTELKEKLERVFPPQIFGFKGKPRTGHILTPEEIQQMGLWQDGYEVFKAFRLQPFNPSSRKQIADGLKKLYGWVPKEFTESGEAKVDETVLSKLDFPEAKLLAEYFLIEKRIGQIAEGDQAWLKLERNGRIHGRVNTMGAVTSRCTHSHPNTAQVPSHKAPYGKECRELWFAPDGYSLLGCDVSGLELRCLAHFMARYDGGTYGQTLLTGDIHSLNQEAAGLPTRDNAKTFIYAFLYGAGDEKIGKIVGKGKKAGAALKANFLEKTPALKKLREAVQAKAQKGYIVGIDGRIMPCRSTHSSLNTLLQGCGAIICKRWVVEFHKMARAAGYVHGRDYAQVAFVHDEIQVLVRKGLEETIGNLCIAAIKAAGEYYGIRIPLDGEYKVGANWAETH